MQNVLDIYDKIFRGMKYFFVINDMFMFIALPLDRSTIFQMSKFAQLINQDTNYKQKFVCDRVEIYFWLCLELLTFVFFLIFNSTTKLFFKTALFTNKEITSKHLHSNNVETKMRHLPNWTT